MNDALVAIDHVTFGYDQRVILSDENLWKLARKAVDGLLCAGVNYFFDDNRWEDEDRS